MTLFVYISPLNFPDNTHCPNIPMSENNLSGLCPKNPFDFRFLSYYFASDVNNSNNLNIDSIILDTQSNNMSTLTNNMSIQSNNMSILTNNMSIQSNNLSIATNNLSSVNGFFSIEDGYSSIQYGFTSIEYGFTSIEYGFTSIQYNIVSTLTCINTGSSTFSSANVNLTYFSNHN